MILHWHCLSLTLDAWFSRCLSGSSDLGVAYSTGTLVQTLIFFSFLCLLLALPSLSNKPSSLSSSPHSLCWPNSSTGSLRLPLQAPPPGTADTHPQQLPNHQAAPSGATDHRAEPRVRVLGMLLSYFIFRLFAFVVILFSPPSPSARIQDVSFPIFLFFLCC